VITVIMPISRKEYLLPMFKCLEELKKPEDTELLLILDGDQELGQMVDSLLDLLSYRRVQVRDFGDSPAAALHERRMRISQVHNFAKQFISEDVDQVFLVEDDTNFSPDSMLQLKKTMDGTGAAFVQGIEVGRWKTPYIGGWLVNDIHHPTKVTSVAPQKGILEIDAGGLYCALVDANEYFMHLFEPYDKIGKNGLACDLNFGLWLRQKGKTVLMDWSVECGHYKEGRQLRLEDVKPVIVTFEKDMNGKWLGTGNWHKEVS
jgi:hypothetical protein